MNIWGLGEGQWLSPSPSHPKVLVMNRIGYIIRSYPRLSQTFILNEILALEELGVQLHLFPSTDPREPVVQAQAAEVRAPVEYLEQATARGRMATLAAHLRAAL